MLTPGEALALVKETLRLQLENGEITEFGYDQALRELLGPPEDVIFEKPKPMPPEVVGMIPQGEPPRRDPDKFIDGVPFPHMPPSTVSLPYTPVYVSTAAVLSTGNTMAPIFLPGQPIFLPGQPIFVTAEEQRVHNQAKAPKRRKGKKR